MRRVPLSLLRILLVVGVLMPTPWPANDQAQANSGGIPPFKGTVIKCVGFNLFFITEQAGVYVHNDGPNALVARVRFLDAGGNTHANAVANILPGQTAGFGDGGPGDEFHRVMVAKITSSDPSVIVDAERIAATDLNSPTRERRHITCAPSDDAPDALPI